MSNRTHRISEIVGTSPEGIDAAIRNGVERAALETVKQHARIVEQHLNRERRVLRFQARQQARHFRPHHMARDAEPEAATRRGQSGNRPLVRGVKVTVIPPGYSGRSARALPEGVGDATGLGTTEGAVIGGTAGAIIGDDRK